MVRQTLIMVAATLGLAGLLPIRAHAYEVTLFPATKIFDPEPRILHQKLGLDDAGLIVEDFEGEKLVDGLTVALARHDDSPLGLWYGSGVGEIVDQAEFRISLPNVRLFGIGLGDNDDGAEQVSINGGRPIALQSLPNHVVDGQNRAYYLLIKAAPGEEPVRSVAFSKAYTIDCDHLVLKQGSPDSDRPLQLALDLVDGSRIIGSPAEKSIQVRFFGVDAEIPYTVIASVELKSGNRNAAILLGNGDRFSADMQTKRWRVKTGFGEQSIPRELIKAIGVQTRTPELKVSFDQEPCNQHTRRLFSGFTVTSGDVNVVGGDCDNTPDFSTPSRAIDLDGASGSVTESERIFAAGNYQLEFSLAGHPFRPGTVLVEFGTFSKEYHLAARQPFVKERERVVVEKPAKLRFTFEGSGEGGPTLDNVVVGKDD